MYDLVQEWEVISGSFLSSDKISQLKSDLELISGVIGWKVTQKNGLVAWLEIPVIKCESINLERINSFALLSTLSSNNLVA